MTAAKEDPLQTAERALKVVYTALLPRLARNPDRARLGFARVQHEARYVRTPAVLLELSKELRTSVAELTLANEASADDPGRRMERQHMEDAALELIEYVRGLPEPIRDVLEARGRFGWRKVYGMFPGRVACSLRDDYEAGLRRILRERDDLVRRLTA